MQSQLCVQHLLKHVLFMCSEVCHHVGKCGSILTFNLNVTFRSTNGNATTWSSCLCHLANYAHRYSTRSWRNLWGWPPRFRETTNPWRRWHRSGSTNFKGKWYQCENENRKLQKRKHDGSKSGEHENDDKCLKPCWKNALRLPPTLSSGKNRKLRDHVRCQDENFVALPSVRLCNDSIDSMKIGKWKETSSQFWSTNCNQLRLAQ